MTYDTTSDWFKNVLSKVRAKTAFSQEEHLHDIQAVLRSHRKILLGTAMSLEKLICSAEQYNEERIHELSAYLAARSMCFISGNSCLTLEFFQRFYWYSIQIITSGNVGNESVDDLIQLADCIVRNIEIYSIVARDCLPATLHQPFEEWVNTIDVPLAAELQDAVLGAICVFVGRLKDPFYDN